MRIPLATYRLQLRKEFKFVDAARITPYLRRLGISDCYSSPILKARTGSTHGYDVVDHNQLYPEIGTQAEFNEWTREIRSLGMGLLLDIVPNHMAFSEENELLRDVLEFGPFSRYSRFFDINWNHRPKNKLILPILGTDLPEAIAKHDLSLGISNGEFSLRVYSQNLPLAPKSCARILEKVCEKLRRSQELPKERIIRELEKITRTFSTRPDSSSAYADTIDVGKRRLATLCRNNLRLLRAVELVLDEISSEDYAISSIIQEQFYELGYWKGALPKINYRRFATVSELIAIHAEDPKVFEETHSLVLKLVASRKVTGLRVDHIDGLLLPGEYLTRLQQSCRGRLTKNAKPFYVIVEKILEEKEEEELPARWRVHGTTGYNFLSDANSIFVQHSNESKFDRIYSKFISNELLDYENVVANSREKIIDESMQSDLDFLVELLSDIIGNWKRTSKSRKSLRTAIKAVAVWFPVYRTYSDYTPGHHSEERFVRQAARRASLDLQEREARDLVDLIQRILLLRYPKGFKASQKKKWRRFALRFEQFTAPVAAKGVEDTAFYIYDRLASLNEVGGSPDLFGISIDEFHKRNLRRLEKHPLTLLATSTHDTKRSEDVRARLNVLSEIPKLWEDFLRSAGELNDGKKQIINGRPAPSKNDEYLFYQAMLGIWPPDGKGTEDLTERLSSYMVKAAREEKINTSWIDQNSKYEESLESFIASVLEDEAFATKFSKIQKLVSYHGMLNSLSQLLLKLTCPGIPDIYQGNEIWDFSLVDPDNRRPVDYSVRSKMLATIETKVQCAKDRKELVSRELLSKMEDGMIKMYILSETLKFRAAHKDLFDHGSYAPLEVSGEKRDHICSFMRKAGDFNCIVIAPRFFVSLLNGAKYDETDVWGNTSLIIPGRKKATNYTDIFTNRKVPTMKQKDGSLVLPFSNILSAFPVAVLFPSP